jgi:uncharacterized protein YlxW (UPF0749 family)
MAETEQDLRSQLEEARATIATLQEEIASSRAELAALRELRDSKADASGAFDQVRARLPRPPPPPPRRLRSPRRERMRAASDAHSLTHPHVSAQTNKTNLNQKQKRLEEVKRMQAHLASLKQEQAEADAAREAAWQHLRAVVGEISKVQGPEFDPAKSLAA